MNRTWVLAGVFLLLVLIMFMLFNREKQGDSSFDEYEGNFRINNVNDIDRIFIAHRDGETIDLKRKTNHWIVNDTFRVRQSAIDVILEAVSRLDIKYIPTDAAIPNIVNGIATFGIKVEIYNRKGEALRQYYIGGSTQDGRGTFMIKEGSEQPFAMHLPAMDGSIRPRFELRLQDWRDRHFLNLDPEDIQKVTVNYPRSRPDAFILERDGRSFDVQALYKDIPVIKGDVRKSAAEKFLYELSLVACESYENAYPRKDSIRALLPWSEFMLNLSEGDSIGFTLYPRGPLVESEFSDPVHHVFIDCSTGDFMLGQFMVLKNIHRSYEYFILEE